MVDSVPFPEAVAVVEPELVLAEVDSEELPPEDSVDDSVDSAGSFFYSATAVV